MTWVIEMKRLVALRKRAKITQEKLARFMGVSRATIGHWETGKVEPDINALIRLSSYFGVTIDYLD